MTEQKNCAMCEIEHKRGHVYRSKNAVSAQANMLCKGKVFFRQLKYNFGMFSKAQPQFKNPQNPQLTSLMGATIAVMN